MKTFKYEVHDELGLLRGYDTKWEALNHVKNDALMFIKINKIPKVNKYANMLSLLGEALI